MPECTYCGTDPEGPMFKALWCSPECHGEDSQRDVLLNQHRAVLQMHREPSRKVRSYAPSRQREVKQYHSLSPLGRLEVLLNAPWCPVCSLWGGEQRKKRGRVMCSYHVPSKPSYQCLICGARTSQGGPHCGLEMMVKWPWKPEWLRSVSVAEGERVEGYRFLKSETLEDGSKVGIWVRPVVTLYVLGASSGVRGLEALQRGCEMLGLELERVLDEGVRLSTKATPIPQEDVVVGGLHGDVQAALMAAMGR